jgi:MATE family multidrug resistance protein
MDSYRAHVKKNFLLAYPVMLSQFGHIMVGVADSMMVGQLGAVPLAAASLGNVIFHFLMAFGIGLSCVYN